MKNRSNRPPVLVWVMLVLVVGLLAGGCAWRIVESGNADTWPGIAIALLGGEMMGGSLMLLAESFPGSQLRFDRLTGLFGESGFGPLTRLNTGLLEGAVFALGVVGTMLIHERGRSRRSG